jgi:hypothetical protein
VMYNQNSNRPNPAIMRTSRIVSMSAISR